MSAPIGYKKVYVVAIDTVTMSPTVVRWTEKTQEVISFLVDTLNDDGIIAVFTLFVDQAWTTTQIDEHVNSLNLSHPPTTHPN